jgi:hypothetical protein
MAENESLNSEMIRGMVEDYWRSYIPMCSQNPSAAIEIRRRFDDRIAATASLMPKEKADEFLQAIDVERLRLCNENECYPDAQKRRLGIQVNRIQQPSYHRQGMGEMVVRTAVRATIWEAIFSIFRR